jgi:hypothetical protein
MSHRPLDLDGPNLRKMDMRFVTWNVNVYIGQVRSRQRRKWADNIKMDLRGIGWDGVDWIELAQDRDQWRAIVNTVMYLRVS